MTKISKKSAYPIKKPVKRDYFVGTDSENFNKTVNFDFEDATAVINELNGQSVIGYQFRFADNILLGVLEEATFYSLAGETTISDITKLYVNKYTKNSLNLTNLYNYLLVNSGDFLFKLQGTDPNVYVYFNLTSVENHSDYYIFNVSLYKGNVVLPELISFGEYFFNFELKSIGSDSGSDPLKLDKSTYTGNAQDLDTRIDALETVISTEYTTIVYVNTNSPNLATIFDDVNPPTTNDNALKANENNLYIGVNLSTWVYNSLILGYVTKSVALTSNFYLAGTGVDAGNNKTDAIKRDGTVEALGFIKSGATSDDVLLGDGSTVSLGGIGSVETAASIKSKYESNADTNAFTDTLKAKLDSITEIFTTALKATYDGVVTGYNALMLTGSRLITSGEITKLSNTSGTNSGDNATNTQYSGLAASKQDTLVSGTNIKTINGDSVLGSGNLIVGGDMTASEINTTVEGVITTLTTNGYTLQLSDADTRINLAIAVGSSSVIVPTNAVVAFPIGTKIKLSRTANGTNLTAISGSGVTFIAPNGLNIYGNNNSATLIKIATNTWEVHITIPFYYNGGLIFSDIGFYAPAFYATQLYADNFGINGGVRLTSATNWLVYGKIYTNADGIYPSMYCSSTFSPTSGTAQFQGLALNMVINQTGGANGITTGLRVNPTLTSAFDFRAVDVVSGSIVFPYLTKTATYSISNNDYLIDCTSGTFTVTLPTAVGQKGKNYVIKNSGAGVITVATTSSQTIDGATTYSLAVQYNSITIVSDNTNWIIISKT